MIQHAFISQALAMIWIDALYASGEINHARIEYDKINDRYIVTAILYK